jgi:hypothetical protein
LTTFILFNFVNRFGLIIVTIKDSIMAKPTLAKFTPPVIHDNETGWGPTGTPDQFKDMPYQPFAKGDRLGKVRINY